MPIVCHSIHDRFEGIQKRSQFGLHDKHGRPNKSCRQCEYSIFTNDLICKCCGARMRTVSRGWRSKQVKKERELFEDKRKTVLNISTSTDI